MPPLRHLSEVAACRRQHTHLHLAVNAPRQQALYSNPIKLPNCAISYIMCTMAQSVIKLTLYWGTRGLKAGYGRDLYLSWLLCGKVQACRACVIMVLVRALYWFLFAVDDPTRTLTLIITESCLVILYKNIAFVALPLQFNAWLKALPITLT